MTEPYQYQPRHVEKNPAKEFRFGEGRISCYLSLTLSVLSLLAVLAYLYPAYLTTAELRQVYDAEQLQLLLKYAMYFSLLFAALTFGLNKGKYKLYGLVAISLTLIGFALGGYNIPIGQVEPRELSLGVDWLILAFLGSVVIFMTLEKLFPKYRDQVITRPEWAVDMFYFCFNHLAISVILIFANYLTTFSALCTTRFCYRR